MLQIGKLTAACSVAAATVLFFMICQRLAGNAALPATILFALGTCLCSVASQALWMHGPATFWLCASLYLLSVAGAEHGCWRLAAGLALGLAVITRPTTVAFALATEITLLGQRRWREAAWLMLGATLPVACLCLLNGCLFGDWVLGGYAKDNWSDSPPWWLGLSGLLIAPSRGVLVYSPGLLLFPLGAWQLIQRNRAKVGGVGGLLLAWLAAAGVTLMFYARWHDWRGGWCYGPRFLCETMPVLCLLFAIGYGSLKTSWQRRLAECLVALSVIVHLLGIFGYGGYAAWNLRHERPDQGRCLFAFDDTQIEAHARALVRELNGRKEKGADGVRKEDRLSTSEPAW